MAGVAALLIAFTRKPSADRRLIVLAAVLQVIVAVAVRVLPFARVRALLDRLAALGPRPRDIANVDARVVQAVQSVAARLPGATCLTDALVAQCLLSRHRRETALCFGVARDRTADRPFDAHAWLEQRGSGLIGARAIVYDPLRHPSRCASSSSPR
jgi:hypothetical protein